MINGMMSHDAAASRNSPTGLTRKHVKKNEVIAIDKAFISRSYAFMKAWMNICVMDIRQVLIVNPIRFMAEYCKQ